MTDLLKLLFAIAALAFFGQMIFDMAIRLFTTFLRAVGNLIRMIPDLLMALLKLSAKQGKVSRVGDITESVAKKEKVQPEAPVEQPVVQSFKIEEPDLSTPAFVRVLGLQPNHFKQSLKSVTDAVANVVDSTLDTEQPAQPLTKKQRRALRDANKAPMSDRKKQLMKNVYSSTAMSRVTAA
ncbi:hypothetical protein [Vibrio agarivorans]|uniref:Uncharacterized protein n=1 Tax=Vibrio agarivorans TaxID=153622 RepID=A0ABT7Y795_9VIBR|nr:hypothetical protein [Vibrio agarivorans]MDN2483925.1 hypothetical protein [Vibrio agarivorans]